MSKVWANGFVITVAVGFLLAVVVRQLLGIPVAGSVSLFLGGVAIYLFFATAVGIFLATIADHAAAWPSLYAGRDADEHAVWQQYPSREHASSLAEHHVGLPVNAFRLVRASYSLPGAGIDVVWREFAAVALIGSAFFTLALLRFRSSAAQTT